MSRLSGVVHQAVIELFTASISNKDMLAGQLIRAGIADGKITKDDLMQPWQTCVDDLFQQEEQQNAEGDV